jgi:hypothetical protein
MFENRVLKRIFGTNREAVAGGWRRLHKEELHNLYTPQNNIRTTKSRRMRLEGRVARMVRIRNVYKPAVGEPEGKRPLGIPRRRWKDNIRMDLRK